VTDREVLEENYGGPSLNDVIAQRQGDQVKVMDRLTNAYMLVYVRETVIDEVLAPLASGDVSMCLSKLVLDWGQRFLAHVSSRAEIG